MDGGALKGYIHRGIFIRNPEKGSCFKALDHGQSLTSSGSLAFLSADDFKQRLLS